MLKLRIATALILAPLFILAVLTFTTPQFWWLLACLFAVGGWEWARFVDLRKPVLRLLIALLVAAAVIGGSQLAVEESIVTAATGVFIWIVACLWLARANLKATTGLLARLGKGLFGFLLIVFGALALGSLYSQPDGRYWLLLLLLLIWAADIGAYVAGRTLGRHKLAPNVSPGKTWEGVVGGLLLATAVALFASRSMALREGQLVWLLTVSLATIAISVIGDLFISLMKRQAGLKDAGRIFPGHGGVLDRFDSLIAAAPVFLLGKHLAGIS